MTTSTKKVKIIETSSDNNWNAADNITEYSDNSNYSGSNNSNSDNNDSSKTDQTTEKLPANMMNNKNKQM
eukprot:8696163-Ditylum_brightwellii.AAC.2